MKTISRINILPFILTFICFIFHIKTDCPIQNYPAQTIIGFINAQINTNPEKQNQQQTYTYTMKQALSTASPHVLIGINSISFDIKSQLRYRALYQPTPRFGTLNFKVLVNDTNNKWKRLQFNFIATDHTHILANTIQFNTMPQITNKTKYSLVSTIPVQDGMKVKPIIQAYISGIGLKAKLTQKDLQNAMRQIDALKRFSWNIQLVRAINQMIVNQSTFSYQITAASLSNNSLTIELSFSDSIIIDSLSISYIIINSVQFPLQNNILNHSFTLGGQSASFAFKSLQNTELTFIGLRGAQHKINSQILIDFSVTKSKNSFSIFPTFPIPDGHLIFASDIQMQTKVQFQCQNCQQSIFKFETYCLTSCPRGYVNVNNGANSSCKYCNISQFLIPNKNLTQCQCAKQYYVNQQSKVCETCHYSCLTCTNNSVCTSCDTADKMTKRIINQKDKTCICIDGFFDNKQNLNLICEKCHESCATCSGSSIYQCIKCKDGRNFDTTKRCQCGPNFVQQSAQCLCKDPNTLVNGICYSKIILGALCSKPHMIQIQVNGQNACDCQKGYTFYNNQCFSCPDTLFFNITTGKCECPDTSYPSSSGACISCDSMKYYNAKYQKCLCRKQYFQKQDGTCIDCPDKSSYINGNCQCVFNYYLKANVCVKCLRTSDDINCLRNTEEL